MKQTITVSMHIFLEHQVNTHTDSLHGIS